MNRIGLGVLTVILVSTLGFFSWHKCFSPSARLTVALNDEDAQVRATAVQALSSVRNEAALEPLLAALPDEDAQVRRAAARAVQHVLPAVEDPQTRAQAVEPLIRALGDTDRDVRGSAIVALDMVGEPALAFAEIGEPVLDLLISRLRDEGVQARPHAAEKLFSVLSLCRPVTRDKALDYILRATGKEEDRELSRAVGIYLGRMGEPAFETLLAAIQDEDHQARSAVAIAMQHVLPAIEDPKTRAQAIDPLILAMKDEAWEVRRYAPIALAKIGEPALDPLLRVILEEDCGERCCDDLCSSAALAIREILSAREDKELTRRFITPLVDQLSDTARSPVKRANSAYGLSQILFSRCGDPVNREIAISALITALKDPSQEVRAEAATALNRVLGGSKDPDTTGRAVDPLLAALQDDSPSVRERVAYTLGALFLDVEEQTNLRDAVDSLVLRLQDPAEPDSVREAAASALSWIGTKEAREAVIDAGFDPEHPPTPREGPN